MNENDRKIRKQWLIMWNINLLLGIVNLLVQLQVGPFVSASPEMRYAFVAISLAVIALVGYALYHCIYKKPGTKFLTFILFFTLINLVITPISYLTGKMPVFSSYYGTYIAVSQVAGILWLIAGWRMRKVNKKLQTLAMQ